MDVADNPKHSRNIPQLLRPPREALAVQVVNVDLGPDLGPRVVAVVDQNEHPLSRECGSRSKLEWVSACCGGGTKKGGQNASKTKFNWEWMRGCVLLAPTVMTVMMWLYIIMSTKTFRALLQYPSIDDWLGMASSCNL